MELLLKLLNVNFRVAYDEIKRLSKKPQSGEQSPKDKLTSKAEAADLESAGRWGRRGDFIVRIHDAPRCTLFCPVECEQNGGKCHIPLEYSSSMRVVATKAKHHTKSSSTSSFQEEVPGLVPESSISRQMTG